MINENIKINEQAVLKTYIWEDSFELAVISRPAVLVLPGGGYMMCSDREAEPIALAYAAEGFNAFVLKYTVTSGFEAPFADAESAMSIVKNNSEKWHIAPEKIAVCGFSAGGHLACALGTMSKYKPNAMILGYPALIGKDWEELDPNIPDLIEKVDDKTCPTFIAACIDDFAVKINNSIMLMEALNKSKIPFECHIYRAGGHGFSLAKTLTASGNTSMINGRVASWFDMSVSWLKETIGDIVIKEKTAISENVSPAIYSAIDTLLANEKTREILLAYSSVFENKVIMKIAGEAPLADMIVSIGLSNEEIFEMSYKIEKALKE